MLEELQCPTIARDIGLSKYLKIFSLLPFSNFRLEAFNLGALDEDVLIDELFAERFSEESIIFSSSGPTYCLPNGGQAIGFRRPERIFSVVCEKGLMQTPARQRPVRNAPTAPKCHVITIAMADLLHGAAEQHHRIGGLKSEVGWKTNSHLLGILDLDESKRQA